MNSREWSNKIQSNLTERISFSLHSPDSVFAQLPTALFTISAVAARVAIRAVSKPSRILVTEEGPYNRRFQQGEGSSPPTLKLCECSLTALARDGIQCV